jgi:iron complex outermembrane recepter protein
MQNACQVMLIILSDRFFYEHTYHKNMNKSFTKIAVLAFILFFSFISVSQTFVVKGNIKDVTSGEALIGASVIAKPGVGGVADIEGNYSFKIEPGTYILKVNYVGYLPMESKIKVLDKDVVSNFLLESQTLDEVEITANIGTVRETPVAITNISQQKIQEELAGRDLPMILNSTPGVYATEQGGGSGDSRITLRGFDQANIAVMVDGVPVNN